MLGVSERVITGSVADGFLLLLPPGGLRWRGARVPVGAASCAVPGMRARLDLASRGSGGSNGLRYAILGAVGGGAFGMGEHGESFEL